MTNTNKIFTIENTNKSKAIGITIENKGGTTLPDLEQPYTFGAVVKATP
jgi:hypothetical protein